MRHAAYPVLVLGATGLSVVTADARYLAGLSLLGLAARTWAARASWTPSGVLGWANALTWLRIVATAALALLPGASMAVVALAFGIFALDGADGAIARARGATSAFGAELDKECDAFYVITLCLLLWLEEVAGPWVLIAGIWRYAYSLLVALGPRLRPAPRSSWGRYTYSTSCLCLMAALIPDNPIAVPMAAAATFAISASFVRSLYYSLSRS